MFAEFCLALVFLFEYVSRLDYAENTWEEVTNLYSVADRVRSAFDREFGCPECGDDLRVLRRGGLLFGCEGYPACDTSFAVPHGRHDGTCPCGLPVFETATRRRCLDSQCETHETAEATGTRFSLPRPE